MFEISKEDTFCGAHHLRDYNGKCEAMHGHNWKVQVFVATENLDDQGLALDFVVLGKYLKETLDRFDHKDLNEVPPFDKLNPSSENISKFIFAEISAKVNDSRVRVSRVKVWESDKSCAEYSARK